MRTVSQQAHYNDLFDAIDGKPNIKEGGKYHMNMLSLTCHFYFGAVLGATPNGRFAGKPISDGTALRLRRDVIPTGRRL